MSGGGHKIIDVDYDTYASGEAELGWLNASVSLSALQKMDWNVFARELIGRIHKDLASCDAEIGHLKLLISSPTGQVVANATSIDETPVVRNDIRMACEGAASLILNARARIEPQVLESIVKRAIRAVAENVIDVSALSLHSFKPAYPKPTYRFDKVVLQP
jgi:hypothetical protein